MRIVGTFFSVAITTPFVAIHDLSIQFSPDTPTDIFPWFTALRAYSICRSFPEGLNVVNEKEYERSILINKRMKESEEIVIGFLSQIWFSFEKRFFGY